MKSIHFFKKKSVIENRTWELYFLGQITSIHNGQFRANILMKFRANMGIVKCADMPENLKKWHCPSSPVELGKHPCKNVNSSVYFDCNSNLWKIEKNDCCKFN